MNDIVLFRGLFKYVTASETRETKVTHKRNNIHTRYFGKNNPTARYSFLNRGFHKKVT